MPLLNYEQVIAKLKAKEFAPIYLLAGEEPFFIEKIADYLEQSVLDESEKAFNQVTLYGWDVDAKAVLDYVNQYPLMAERRVVILKEAQSMKQIDQLINYFKNPAPSTVLIMLYKNKKPDKRTAFYKAIEKSGVVMISSKIYDNQLPAFIKSQIKHRGAAIDEKAAQLLAEYIGTDLSKLNNEIEKLVINIGENGVISSAEIEKYTGINKDFNVFELQRAFALRDSVRLARMAQYFRENTKENPAILLISVLYKYFSKVMVLSANPKMNDREALSALQLGSPFFLKEYRAAAKNFPIAKIERVFTYLLEADKRSKGIDEPSMPEGEIIRELIFKIAYL